MPTLLCSPCQLCNGWYVPAGFTRAGCCWLQKPIHKNIGFSLGDAKGQLKTELVFDTASVSKTKMLPNLSQLCIWQFLFPLNSGHLRDSVAKRFHNETLEIKHVHYRPSSQVLLLFQVQCPSWQSGHWLRLKPISLTKLSSGRNSVQ